MKQKKLMLLGGLRYLVPVIQAAHKLGLYVITCDYLPDNIAHKYSDEYRNVSIIDKDAVLKVAQELEIDGIMSFAVDPGVVTAAYVAEQMGLPFAGSYKAVRILQNKDLFRNFLREHGFNCPWSFGFSDMQELKENIEKISYPAIVKPTDAAGSKGVSRIDSVAELTEAAQYAFSHSISGKIIIEEFLEKQGCSSDSDCFTIDGKLEIATFSAQRFDADAANPYTPSAYSWPSTYTREQEQELRAELQRLASLLGLGTSIYNVETRVATNGKPYIMEVSPRGGGNRLAEMVHYATGINLIENAVRGAVGLEVAPLAGVSYKGHWAIIILHATQSGIFECLDIEPAFVDNVVETDLWVKSGDEVQEFNGANNAIGTLVVRFDDEAAMIECVSHPEKVIRVKVR